MFQIFTDFANENLVGKTVTFIPTAALPLIQTQINAGKLFIGESAGAILLAPDIEYAIDTDNPLAAPQLKTFEALNMIDFYPVPHYKNEPLKEAVDTVISKYGEKLPLEPFSNSQAILVIGKERQIVTQKE